MHACWPTECVMLAVRLSSGNVTYNYPPACGGLKNQIINPGIGISLNAAYWAATPNFNVYSFIQTLRAVPRRLLYAY